MPIPGVRQPLVDLAEQRLAEADILLAEPDRRAEGHQQITQLPRGTLPVVPGVAEEEVATLRVFPRLLLGLAGEGLDRSPFSSRVRDGPPPRSRRDFSPPDDPPDDPPLDDPPPPLQEGLVGEV